MTTFEIISWITTILLALGLIFTWLKWDRSNTSHSAKVEAIVTGIKEDLDSPEKGLDVLNRKIGEIKVDSTDLKRRVINHDREIKELKNRK